MPSGITIRIVASLYKAKSSYPARCSIVNSSGKALRQGQAILAVIRPILEYPWCSRYLSTPSK